MNCNTCKDEGLIGPIVDRRICSDCKVVVDRQLLVDAYDDMVGNSLTREEWEQTVATLKKIIIESRPKG